MRRALGVLTACAVVLVAACSSSAPDTSYNAPDMGTASDLAAGTSTPVADPDAGFLLLQTALANSSGWVTTSGGAAAIAGQSSGSASGPFFALGMSGTKGVPLATSSGSYHVTFAPAASTNNISASGTADISYSNMPSSPYTAGDIWNASMSVSQKLTVTANHASVPFPPSTARYTVSGKEVCNANLSIKATGTYPAISYSGTVKIGFGIACTIVDTSSGASAKFILSTSVDGSLSGGGSGGATYPITGTLYVYNAQDNSLIGSKTLSGSELTSFITLAIGM